MTCWLCLSQKDITVSSQHNTGNIKDHAKWLIQLLYIRYIIFTWLDFWKICPLHFMKTITKTIKTTTPMKTPHIIATWEVPETERDLVV